MLTVSRESEPRTCQSNVPQRAIARYPRQKELAWMYFETPASLKRNAISLNAPFF